MAVRHHDWTHVHVVGDRGAASLYLPEARKLLGQVVQDARFNNLATHQMTRRYQDGATIVAEVRGGIPRVTIAPAPEEGDQPLPEPPDDFVVWARTLGLPEGIDAEHPQQILKEPDGRRGSKWQAFVFNRAVATGRRDGTYGGMFPRGLTHAGNVDWVGEDDERISWYGPSARMFQDGYVHPKAQFGKKVFMLGEVLLDTDQYALDSPDQPHGTDRYIIGAAIRTEGAQAYLVTVQSTGVDGATDTTPIPDGEGRYTYPLAPQAAVRVAIYSYRLRQERDEFGVLRYHVVAGSRVERAFLQTDHLDPWFFNADASEAVVHITVPTGRPSGAPWWVATTIDRSQLPPEDGTVTETPPGWDQARLRVRIGEGFTISVTAQDFYSVVSGGDSRPVCSDYDGLELRSYDIRLGDDLVPYLQFDGAEVPLHRTARQGAEVHGTKRWILHASPRDKLVVFVVEDIRFVSGESSPYDTRDGRGVVVEVWRAGVLVGEQYLQHPMDYPAGMIRYYAANHEKWSSLQGVPIAPSFFVYGLVRCASRGNTRTTYSADFAGCNATYMDLLRTGGAYFGTYDNPTTAGDPSRAPTPLADLARPGFASDRVDADGATWITGCAASARSTVVSAAVPTPHHEQSFHHLTRGDLPGATGITGAGERYHPLWLLGKPPKPLTA